MRGTDKRSGELFSYVDLEQRVRADHPLRAIRSVVSEALDALSGEFGALDRASSSLRRNERTGRSHHHGKWWHRSQYGAPSAYFFNSLLEA